MERKFNRLMEKGIKYVGLIVISIAVFFVVSAAIVWFTDVVYWNTSLLDNVDSYIIDPIQIAVSAIIMNNTYKALKKHCFR